MAKINSLRDIIQFNSNFKTAINLYLSLNKAEKVLGYIPTKSSVSFLGEYLKAVLENKEQATLLVGPYGKGKSHLLLVLLAVLSMKKTPESESAINELIDNVSKTDEVGERVSEYIGQVWDKKRFLPVLITDTTGDLNQAFLYGLNDALKRDGLLDLAPETYYSIALDRIDDWEQNYFETYKMFERELTQNGMSIAELKTDLKQYSQKTLILFKEIYPKVTAGSEFNPMALADALPLYKSVSEKLVDEYGYKTLYGPFGIGGFINVSGIKLNTFITFDDTQSPSTDIINTVENDPATSDIDDENEEDEETPPEVIAETGKEELKEIGYEDPTDEQGTAFINNSINFVYADKGERSPAFDYKPVLKTTVITINTSHKFYTSFLSKIYSNAEVKTTFELFLASLIQSVRKTDPYQAVQNDRLMTTWYNRLNNYIAEQLNPRDMK